MKKIEIEIPDGKRAEWKDGVLTLIDDNIMERVTTFLDAIGELGEKDELVKEYHNVISAKFTISRSLLAYLKLRIVTKALNEGWKFEIGGFGYCPWFEIKNAGLVRAYAGNGVGVASYVSGLAGSSLVFKSSELARYAGEQFKDLYEQFITGEKK